MMAAKAVVPMPLSAIEPKAAKRCTNNPNHA
jgi:hypothetical protein